MKEEVFVIKCLNKDLYLNIFGILSESRDKIKVFNSSLEAYHELKKVNIKIRRVHPRLRLLVKIYSYEKSKHTPKGGAFCHTCYFQFVKIKNLRVKLPIWRKICFSRSNQGSRLQASLQEICEALPCIYQRRSFLYYRKGGVSYGETVQMYRKDK